MSDVIRLSLIRLSLAFVFGSAVFVCATSADDKVSIVTSAAQPTSPVTHTLTGTIRHVHEDGIEIINGVQLALKLTYIAVDADTEIRRGDESIPFQELRAGELVTVSYRDTERGKVAAHIIVQPPLVNHGADHAT